MEVVSFCSSGSLDKTFDSFIKASLIQTTLPPASAAAAAAFNTLTCWLLLFLVGALSKETDLPDVVGVEKSFPFDELSGVAEPGTENMDADDMDDDDDDDDDEDNDDSDDDDDDFSGEDSSDEEGGLKDDSDANSNGGSDDNDDDEDENNQPPSTKK